MSVAERLRAGDVEDRLAAMAELAAPDAGDAELDALASCLGHDRKIVQRRAAEAFGALAAGGVPVRPVLERALHAPGARQRWGAAYALALIGAPPPETLPVLLEALGEDDGDLRWAAARILVRMWDDAALRPTLVDLAAAGNAPQRKMALYCLRDLEAPSSDAERAALVALRDADTAVRLAALSALPAVAVDRPATARAVLASLEDGDGGVRRAAAAALGKLGSRSDEITAALRAAAGGADVSLTRAAERAMRQLGVPKR